MKILPMLYAVYYRCSGDRGIILTVATYLAVCLGYWIRLGVLPDSTFCGIAMIVVAGLVLAIGKLALWAAKLQQRKIK